MDRKKPAGVVDLAALQKQRETEAAQPPIGAHLIFRDEASGQVTCAVRLAYGTVLSVEADGSINVSPITEFELDEEQNLNRIGDPNKPNVISYVMPVALVNAMMEQAQNVKPT